jgi:hypothetical protein
MKLFLFSFQGALFASKYIIRGGYYNEKMGKFGYVSCERGWLSSMW